VHWVAKNRQGRGNKPVTPAMTKLHYLVLNNVLQFAAQNRAISVKPARGQDSHGQVHRPDAA